MEDCSKVVIDNLVTLYPTQGKYSKHNIKKVHIIDHVISILKQYILPVFNHCHY